MKISELISTLNKYKEQQGDVVLYSQKGDGRSSWNSPIQVSIRLTTHWPDTKDQKRVYLSLDAGY